MIAMNQYRIILFFLLVALSAQTQAQTRAFLRNKITEWGECKSVAITKHGGDLAIYGKNGWAKTGNVPSGLIDEIRSKNSRGETLQDVVVTEDGSWLLLYGENGMSWGGLTDDLTKVLREYNRRAEVITSVAFNDSGDWLVVGEQHWTCSSTELTDFIKAGAQSFGNVWTAHFNDDGLVVVYDKGIKYDGEVPENVIDALNEVEFDVYRFKFLPDGSYFMADRKGSYKYFF